MAIVKITAKQARNFQPDERVLANIKALFKGSTPPKIA
jgi:hypothetical protein